MVTIRSRSCLAPLSSRRMRRIRSTRSTRSSIGGSGRTAWRSSAANSSRSDMQTREKSKQFHESAKYPDGAKLSSLRQHSA